MNVNSWYVGISLMFPQDPMLQRSTMSPPDSCHVTISSVESKVLLPVTSLEEMSSIFQGTKAKCFEMC